MSAKLSGLIYCAAAASTAIAGMLHLMLGPGMAGFNPNQAILFIVGGLAQVFWIVPTVRRWGRVWYSVGIVGTAVFMALFWITRMPGNPITGRGGGVNSIAMAVEVFQALFIAFTVAIFVYEYRMRRKLGKVGDAKGGKEDHVARNPIRSKKSLVIIAGVAAALALVALFILPMTMPGPMGRGGPPGQGGRPPPGAQGSSGSPNGGGPPQGTAQLVDAILFPPLLDRIK